jgi:hypothetical protein
MSCCGENIMPTEQNPLVIGVATNTPKQIKLHTTFGNWNAGTIIWVDGDKVEMYVTVNQMASYI